MLKNSEPTSFIHSNEILFGQKIYLQDYCKCIVIKENTSIKEYTKIKKLCDKLNISLVVRKLGKDKPFIYYTGLNNFIDYVNNINEFIRL
jgi:hypothetical protein